MKSRDEFKASTKYTLAARAQFSCSFEGCSEITIGPALGHQGVINSGEAAHITAAAPDGPRFDPGLTPEQRRSAENGIWMCRRHAWIIDRDEQTYTVDQLRRWKAEREARSAGALVDPMSAAMRAAAEAMGKAQAPPPALPARFGRLLEPPLIQEMQPDQRRRTVGEVVLWGRLCDGSYANRPHLMSRLLGDYLNWLCDLPEIYKQRKLPIFCIDGRSGDGKSVLLLQLAAEILKTNMEAPIYLASRPDAVAEIMEFLAQRDNSDTQIFIFVEDLYKVTDIDELNNAILVQGERQLGNVAIVTCAPTPERAAFCANLGNISPRSWSVPMLAQDDIEIFAEWFGVGIPENITLSSNLLVEVLFAINVGRPIPEFARHFKHRLQGFGVFEKTRQIVALNTMGLSAPLDLLDSVAEQDAIRRLTQEDQLHFETREEVWGDGVQLVHRAIAWRLFDEWSSEPLVGLPVAIRLARAIYEILNLQTWPYRFYRTLIGRLAHTAPGLFEDSRSADEDEPAFWRELLSRADGQGNAATTVAEAYLQRIRDLRPLAMDPDCISRVNQIVSSGSANPVRRARIAALLALLERSGKIEAEGWRSRAEQLCLESPATARTWGAARILITYGGSNLKFAEAWINTHNPSEECRRFLNAALSTFGASEILAEPAATWVEANWANARAVEVLIKMMIGAQGGSRAKALALRWIDEKPSTSSASDLLQLLLRAEPLNAQFRARAANWVACNPLHPSSSVLVVRLLSVSDGRGRRDLKPVIYHILTHDPKASRLSEFLPAVLKTYGSTFQDLAAEWFQANAGYARACDVASGLIKVNPSPENINASLEWCVKHCEHLDVSHVMSVILRYGRSDETVSARVAVICEEQLYSRTIFNPIATLLRLHPDEPSFRRLGLDWIDQHSDSGASMQLLSSLLKNCPSDEPTYEAALEVCRKRILESLTGHLISSIMRSRPDCERARELAFRWLEEHWHLKEAGQVISTLLTTTTDKKAEQLAQRWIDQHRHWRSAQHQLLASLVSNRCDDTFWPECSLDYIEPGRSEGEPPYVYVALCTAHPNDPIVPPLVEAYLYNHKNRADPRETVLNAWIEAPGSHLAIPTVVRITKSRDRLSEEGMHLHGILIKSCAKQWALMQQTAISDKSLAGDICYLVGRGMPSVKIDFAEFTARLEDWPREHVCFILAGLLRSRCSPDLFWKPLAVWLEANWRRRGYGVVLDALDDRLSRDMTFALRIPRHAYKDLGSPRRRSDRPSASARKGRRAVSAPPALPAYDPSAPSGPEPAGSTQQRHSRPFRAP